MNTVIVFVKEPAPGSVKTRLHPLLSHAQAADLYSAFARDTFEVAARVAGARVEVAYDARPEAGAPAWLGAPPVAWFPQDGGDLGERMHAAFERAFAAGARRVVIVGSDLPDLDSGRVAAAFLALERRPLVLGPAEDGGYYLLGLTRPCAELFRSMPWSTPDVLDQTIGRAERLGFELELLESCRDVDTGEDLSALRVRLSRCASGARHTRRALEGLNLPAEEGK